MSILTNVAQYTSDLYYTTTTTPSSDVSAAVMVPIVVFSVAVGVLGVVCIWKIYEKAGKPGWAAIVPIYNTWVLFEIVGYPGWWALLSFVPFANFFAGIMAIVAYFKLAKLFGKSDVFAVFTILFPIVTLPILAFGKATFQGGSAPAPGPQAPIAPQSPVVPEAPQISTPSDQPAPVVPPVVPSEPAQTPSTPEQEAPSDQNPTPPQQPLVQ